MIYEHPRILDSGINFGNFSLLCVRLVSTGVENDQGMVNRCRNIICFS